MQRWRVGAANPLGQVDERPARTAQKKKPLQAFGLQRLLETLAEWTGLEPATPGVTGRYSNQLNYHSAAVKLEL